MHFSLATALLLLGAAVDARLTDRRGVQVSNGTSTDICDSECQLGCDASCQASIRRAYEKESGIWVGTVTTDPFYQVNLTANAAPGDLLRWEDIPAADLGTKYNVPSSLSLSRFMYVTEDIDGKPIPASGWVLLPFYNVFGGEQLRTVAWAHGTAGRARQCATTNSKSLWYDWQGPFALAEEGYAVIGPDYSGQGSDIPQGFMYEAGYLHAADVAYSVAAARKAIGDRLSNKWAVHGHSEGGMTAWRTNERLAMDGQEAMREAAGEFVGAVAASPALRPADMVAMTWDWAANSPAYNPFAVYQFQSISALFPDDLKAKDWLTPVALQRIGVLDKSCAITGMAAVGNLSMNELFTSPDWLKLPVVKNWTEKYHGQGSSPHRLAGPMLMLQGSSDFITPPKVTLAEYNSTCGAFADAQIQLKIFTGLGHFEVNEAGKKAVMQWLNDRFEGTPLPAHCTSETINPVTDRFSTTHLNWKGLNALA